MESAVVVVIALVALVSGAVLLLSKQRMLPRTFPALRMSSDASIEASRNGRDAEDSGERLAAAVAEQPMIVPLTSETASTVAEHLDPSELVRLGIVPDTGDVLPARLARIEDRLDELHRLIEKQGEALTAETRRTHSALVSRAEADEARRDAVYERFRTDMVSAVSVAVGQRQHGAPDRGLEVSADLYARLARLEAALSTVTNPILLPGETYAPPTEFLPEAYVWENWNEVGERVFALADAFSAQRLHLSAQTRADVGAFVTTLRTLLTRSVYPNLQPDLDPTRQTVLRMALAEIAVELPKVRAILEREYQAGRSA